MSKLRIIAATAALLLAACPAWADPATDAADEMSDLQKLIDRGEREADNKPEPKPEEPAEAEEPAEEELIDLLMKKAGADGSKPVMQRVMDNMAESRSRLREESDPGAETQRIQRKIVFDLDEAIAAAQQASSSSSSSSSSQGQKKQQGQKQQSKSQSQGQSQPQGGQPQPNRGNQAAQDERASHGSVQGGDVNNVIEEQRKEWGSLPERDREELVQSRDEDFLPRWKALIEKYYTALQIQSEKDND